MSWNTASPYCTILVGVDGSDDARRAAAHALTLARALTARVIVLSVVDTHRTQALGVHYQEAVDELHDYAETAVKEIVEQAREMKVNAEALVVHGAPAQQICQVAADRKADLIVMAAKGRSRLEEMLLGSVSNYVLQHAHRPVLVVHH
ncbi:MAG: universal stress protein [Chloroflexota bacterium]